METIQAISLILGVAWASGINLYAAVLVLGYMGSAGHVTLPPDLQILSTPIVMGAAGLMYVVEFFADKVPGVDTGWDVLHTFVRIPAGAMLAMGMAEGLEMNEAVQFAALLLGGGIAATSHATKAGSRVLINTSPEPFSNWTASITEDVVVVAGLWASLQHPVLFVIALVLFILLVAWLLPKIWRALKRIARAIKRFFSGRDEESTEQGGSTREEIMDAIYQEDKGQPEQPRP
jgi:Sec-independent protein translocase protein TatA